MRHLTCSMITGRYYSLVVSILLCLINQAADCQDQPSWGFNTEYPAICDTEYRTKYFDTEEHREAVLAGTLFVPPEFRIEDAQRIATGSYDENFSKSFLSSEDDYASQVLPIDVNYESSGSMIYAENESSELMDEEDQPSQLIYDTRRYSSPIVRNFTSELYDVKNKLDAKGRYLREGNIIPRTKLSGAGSLDDQKIPSLKSPRGNSFKFYEKDNRDRSYRITDTYRPIYDGRRGKEDNLKTALSEERWIEKSCKSFRRIVGGYGVESAEVLPYMAFVDTGCGGAIISDMWVLTAGHCVDDDDPNYVHVGSFKLMSGCQYNVVKVYIHPKFSRENLEFDVALLKISPTFVFSPAIKPIAMSSVKALRKSCGVVAGWGAREYKGAPRMILSTTTIPIIERKKCRKFGIGKRQFCAGYDDARSDTCQGDSGGPFVVNGAVAGIVSYGYKCARPHTPGVYVDVSCHRKWIRSITGF